MENLKMATPRKRNLISSVLAEKCPHCGQGHVFENSKGIFSMPVMKEKCDSCKYSFDREPGYFIGAMYVSYGLAIFQGIITFLICYFLFPSLETIWIPIAILAVLIVFAKKNFKLARIIYIHLFPW